MIDCQQVRQLLPLWIGRDLPNAGSLVDVAIHLQHCPACDQQRESLQSSLDVLQSTSVEMFSRESSHTSVWPNLVSRISEWEGRRLRERFNGWIPASVMALAAALMIGVSLPSIHNEFFGDGSASLSSADLFQSDAFIPEHSSGVDRSGHQPRLEKTVNWKFDDKREQW